MIQMTNKEMDLVRRKLCKDLEVMECLKEEIEKAGQGEMRDQLEEDFHHGINSLVMFIPSIIFTVPVALNVPFTFTVLVAFTVPVALLLPGFPPLHKLNNCLRSEFEEMPVK